MSVHEILKKIPILSTLKDEELRILERSLIRRQFTKGQVIFKKGEEGGTLYLIRTGRVKVFITSPKGEEIVLATLSSGEILGELSFIDGKTRSAAAQAIENTELLCLLREDFLGLLKNRFDLVLQVLEVLSQRLRDTDALLARKRSQGLSSWLIKKLLDLSRIFGISAKK